jgi:hypothetical protein
MKQINTLLLLALLCTTLFAKEEEQHDHDGSNNIKINYETLDFSNSKKKEEGQRYGVEIDHEDEQHHIQFYYEKTKTHTTNIVPKDLKVNKYTLKYQYRLNPQEQVSLSYTGIDDNLMVETDGGHIYGVGYSNSGLGLTQYFSDYPHFDVYQSDWKYSLKKQGIKTTLIGKYIHLKDKNSNNFSQKAKSNYFTGGMKLHTHYNGFHLGAGAYFGKRIFAVMKEGFKVQHHAMEFKESYMIGVGHALGSNMVAHLRYGYHKAKEIPMNHDNVKVQNISLDVVYQF